MHVFTCIPYILIIQKGSTKMNSTSDCICFVFTITKEAQSFITALEPLKVVVLLELLLCGLNGHNVVKGVGIYIAYVPIRFCILVPVVGRSPTTSTWQHTCRPMSCCMHGGRHHVVQIVKIAPNICAVVWHTCIAQIWHNFPILL